MLNKYKYYVLKRLILRKGEYFCLFTRKKCRKLKIFYVNKIVSNISTFKLNKYFDKIKIKGPLNIISSDPSLLECQEKDSFVCET